jgi:hypothetical protein
LSYIELYALSRRNSIFAGKLSALTKNQNVFMRKITPLLIVSCILLSLIACQKETSLETLGATPGTGGSGPGGSGGGGSTNGTEVGTWKYVYTRQVIDQTILADMGVGVMKSIYSADFTTINNSGTIKFDGTTATLTDLATSVNATMKITSTFAGVTSPAITQPLTEDQPAASSTVTYKKVGTDSLYCPNGGFMNFSFAGPDPSAATGYKLKWDGDKMTLTETFDESSTQTVSGVNAKLVEHTVTTITLQKQ